VTSHFSSRNTHERGSAPRDMRVARLPSVPTTMRWLSLLTFFPVLATSVSSNNPLTLTLGAHGEYSLSSHSWPNLILSGSPVGLQVQGVWLSTGDGSLTLLGSRVDGTGQDVWGAYTSSSFAFAATASPTTPLITTTFKVYNETSAVAFEATFPNGLVTGEASTANKDGIVSSFPAWELPQSGSPLGFVQWAGPFINNGNGGPVVGAFASPGGAIRGGLSGGPLVLLDDTAAASLMLSASSEYMAVSCAVRNDSLGFGPLGSVFSLPEGYTYSAVAFYGEGVNANIQAWGSALLAKHGKPHGLSKTDFTNTHLIYNTDHG
jgi:hypothetical protein